MAIKRINRPVRPPMSRRRERYANDPKFREAAKATARRHYRNKNGMELESCLHSLNFIDEIARHEEVQLPSGQLKVLPIFYLSDTAKALQKLYQTVLRWTHTGQLPKPVLFPVCVGNSVPHAVYHVDEVRVMVSILGEHGKTMAYYRASHKDVRTRIEQGVQQVRTTLGFDAK